MSDPAIAIRRFIGAYPPDTQAQVQTLVQDNRLAPYLAQKYPGRHDIQTDAALYDYVQSLKQQYLKTAPPVHKVVWHAKLDVMHKVLGLHTAISRVQGARLKAKAEIRIAGLFKDAAPEFLEMVVAHELAHLRRRDHLVRWVEWAATVLFWWNPVLWLARRGLRENEELCCDALVLSALDTDPNTYANSLLDALELLATPALRPPVVASQMTSGGSLEH